MVKSRTLMTGISPLYGYFMKKLLLTLLFAPLLFAEPISGIAITMDDELITLYEIEKEMEISQTSLKQSVDALIRLKLEHIEAQQRNISVTNSEVLDELKKMAANNNITLPQLYEAMQSTKHLSESETKEKIKEKLLKDKLYNAIAMSQMQEPTDEEIKEYYNLHLDEYAIAKSVDAVLYTSLSKESLETKIANPMMNIPSVNKENIVVELANINQRVASIISKTKNNNFTPILPKIGGQGHMSFYILKQNDITTPTLESIRPQVENKIMEDKREQVLSEHFQRMRVNADIKVLRLPKE